MTEIWILITVLAIVMVLSGVLLWNSDSKTDAKLRKFFGFAK